MTLTQDASPERDNDAADTEKFVVQMPHSLAEEIREASGEAAVEAWLDDAIAEKRRREAGVAYIADWEAENGPAPQEAVEEFERAMQDAEGKYRAWLANNAE